jgi:hypothetical protein
MSITNTPFFPVGWVASAGNKGKPVEAFKLYVAVGRSDFGAVPTLSVPKACLSDLPLHVPNKEIWWVQVYVARSPGALQSAGLQAKNGMNFGTSSPL